MVKRELSMDNTVADSAARQPVRLSEWANRLPKMQQKHNVGSLAAFIVLRLGTRCGSDNGLVGRCLRPKTTRCAARSCPCGYECAGRQDSYHSPPCIGRIFIPPPNDSLSPALSPLVPRGERVKISDGCIRMRPLAGMYFGLDYLPETCTTNPAEVVRSGVIGGSTQRSHEKDSNFRHRHFAVRFLQISRSAARAGAVVLPVVAIPAGNRLDGILHHGF